MAKAMYIIYTSKEQKRKSNKKSRQLDVSGRWHNKIRSLIINDYVVETGKFRSKNKMKNFPRSSNRHFYFYWTKQISLDDLALNLPGYPLEKMTEFGDVFRELIEVPVYLHRGLETRLRFSEVPVLLHGHLKLVRRHLTLFIHGH